MQTAPSEHTAISHPPTSVQLLHSLMRYMRLLRFRWPLVGGALIVTSLLGGLYYFTAERSYQATAQILVQQTGPIVLAAGSATQSSHQQGMLPTYERLFNSTIVLEGAIERLAELPRDLRADLINTPPENWVGMLRQNASVRSLRLTNVIEISYRSSSPTAAEAVVQALVDSYMAFMKDNHMNVAAELVTILKNERRDVEQQLAEKERALLAAKKRFGDLGLRDASKSLHPLVQRVIRINETLIETQQTRLKLQSSLAVIDRPHAAAGDLRQHLFALEPIIGREAVLSALGLGEQDSETIAKLEQKLIEEKSELDALLPHYGSRHPKVSQLSDSLQQTRVYLANYQETVERRTARLESPRLRKLLLDLVSQELNKAWTQERELKRQYDVAQAEAIQLQGRFEEIAMVQREVDRLANFNHTLLNRIDNIDINQNQTDVRVEVVSRPEASPLPVSPRPLIVCFGCLFTGLSVSAALVYVVDVMDDRFRSPDEMKHQLGAPILAMVRHLKATSVSGLDALSVHVAPDSVETEAFRTLRTTLAFAHENLNCVAITSSEPGDGKTTIAANLALSFAQTNKRTLLIDADLRRPGLTRLLELRGRNGLSDLLKSPNFGEAITQAVYSAGHPDLDVIPSGARPLDPTGLLTSPRFAELLAWAEGRYDQILIDSPPVLVASDAAIVGKMADGLMIVIQPQKNHRRLVVRAVEEIRATGLNFVGAIVNRMTDENGHDYYGRNYGYGYGTAYGESEPATAEQGTSAQTAASKAA